MSFNCKECKYEKLASRDFEPCDTCVNGDEFKPQRSKNMTMEMIISDVIMDDFDPDKYDGIYCKKMNCHACEGTDYNGDPNGYGCQGNDEYIDKRYNSILKRRLKKYKEQKHVE